MTRYRWKIHTADQGTNETLGDVYMSLQGIKASTKEFKLARREFLRDTVESGIIEVRGDLGELQNCSLRTQDSERSNWTPDWLRVINLSDGRRWNAQGAACDADGSCPLLQFKRARDPVELQRSTAGPEQRADEDGDPAPKEDPKQKPKEDRAAEDGRREPARCGPNVGPASKGSGSAVRTYEIFGKHKGRVVPLAEILKIRAGAKQLTPGAQVLLTDQELQGFGLGGEPGLWEDLYPGVDPGVYGLDSGKPVLASDGSRGWAVDAHYLAMIFGANWRRVVYGN
jgi:hypothetical protein